MKGNEGKKNIPSTPEFQKEPVAGGASILMLTKPVLGVLAVLVLSPWVFLGIILKSGPATPDAAVKEVRPPVTAILHTVSPTNRMYVSKPGPWGNLEYTRIAIEPPEEFLYANNTNQHRPHWVFPNIDREKVMTLLKSAELTEPQMKALTQPAIWEAIANGTAIAPPLETVLDLSRRSRQIIYSTLARFPDNGPQNSAYSMRQELLDERFEKSGLSARTVEMVKRLLYPHGDLLLFADMENVLQTMTDQQERMRLLKTISRRNSLLIRLKVDDTTKIDELVNYWGFDGRAKDIRPLLESLTRIPGGGSVDIAHLLPSFARQRIYTYPFPSRDPMTARRDCHWTTFNFFNPQPDDTLSDPTVVHRTIEKDFYPISTGARMGDVVFLVKPTGELVHTATYIADEIVFTKNGQSFTQPWTYMTIKGLLAYYSAFYPPEAPLELMYYRRKNT